MSESWTVSGGWGALLFARQIFANLHFLSKKLAKNEEEREKSGKGHGMVRPVSYHAADPDRSGLDVCV